MVRLLSATYRVALVALAFLLGGLPASAFAKGRAAKGKAGHAAARRPIFRGHAPPQATLRHEPLSRPSGKLHLYSVNYRDEVKVEFLRKDGSYDEGAVAKLNHFVRSRGAGTERAIEPRLYEVLSHVYDHYGERVVELVSGYRDQSSVTSYHYLGSAIDFRVRGVSTRELRNFVETLDSGGMGIGLYPKTGFIHVDIRPEPSYRWIDYSGPSGKRKRKVPTS
jgi:uncharacterized protein YcbK (DUF882 family)